VGLEGLAIHSALEALRKVVPIVEGVARSITVYALVTLAGAAGCARAGP